MTLAARFACILPLVGTPLLALTTTVKAQTSPPSGQCSVRISVLQSYAPLSSAMQAATKLNASPLTIRSDLLAFDTALAGALANVPNEEEAAYALTDVERLVEAIESCAPAMGLSGQAVGQSATALDAAYLRNATHMVSPDFANRLLRSPRAQKVLRALNQNGAIDKAQAAKDAKVAQIREQQAAKAAIAYEQYALANPADVDIASITSPRILEIERAWRSNASAPGSGACGNVISAGYLNKPRDKDWLGLMEAEIGKCKRISDKRDGPYFMGLALGTSVTDEQLAHASGRQLICFSDSAGERLLDATNQAVERIYAAGGLGGTGAQAIPSWSERRTGVRRIVQIRCDISLKILGFDLNPMQQSLATSMQVDTSSYVEFELVGQKLTAIKSHLVLGNEVKRDTGSSGTTHLCDATLAQADTVAGSYRAAGWTLSAKLPWNYMMKNDAMTKILAGSESPGTGSWYTLKRGTVVIDLFNTRYRAPVLGDNGNCNGGTVEEYAMLAATRIGRILPGREVIW